MVQTISTRFSVPIRELPPTMAENGLLVRIYPLDGIEKPVELGESRLMIGREASCALRLNDDSVSRRHAAIERDGDVHYVEDLNSTNGTFLNGKRLNDREPLKNGDRIRFGSQIFKYLKLDQVEVQYHDIVFKTMTTDSLTSVYNKRYFLETLEREMVQTRRVESSLCVILLDLDRFKSVNDTHGHLAGDAVLVEFARRAKSVLRGGEVLARYGGEEFAMILTQASIDDAMAAAERVRQVTAATPMMFESIAIPVTVSIGVHCSDGQSDCTSAELLISADEALYEAKRHGRNQVRSSVPASGATGDRVSQ